VMLMRESAMGMVKAGSVLLMRPLGTEAAMLGNGRRCSAALDPPSLVDALLTTQLSIINNKES